MNAVPVSEPLSGERYQIIDQNRQQHQQNVDRLAPRVKKQAHDDKQHVASPDIPYQSDHRYVDRKKSKEKRG